MRDPLLLDQRPQLCHGHRIQSAPLIIDCLVLTGCLGHRRRIGCSCYVRCFGGLRDVGFAGHFRAHRPRRKRCDESSVELRAISGGFGEHRHQAGELGSENRTLLIAFGKRIQCCGCPPDLRSGLPLRCRTHSPSSMRCRNASARSNRSS